MQLSSDNKILRRVTDRDIDDNGVFHVPAGVTVIGNWAFKDATRLISIVIPEGVTSIGNNAFYSCTNLQMISIPESLQSIGSQAFFYCTSLESLTILNNVTSIEDYAFSGCINLKFLSMPKGINLIGYQAFSNCTSIRSLMIPTGIIGTESFFNCTNLQMVTIGKGVSSIGDGAFNKCASLETVVMEKGLTSIGIGAFSRCNHLKTLIIPESVISLWRLEFKECLKLSLILIDASNETELMRLSDLFPAELKNKIGIKNLYDEAISFRDKQLSRLCSTPQTNQLYRFFNENAKFKSKLLLINEDGDVIEKESPKLPNYIFRYINKQLGNDNPYYQEAMTLINNKSLPKNRNELKKYEEHVTAIVTQCINKAWHIDEVKDNASTCSPN